MTTLTSESVSGISIDLLSGCQFSFGWNDAPGKKIADKKRDNCSCKGKDNCHKADYRRVDVEKFTDSSADTANPFIGFRTIELLHRILRQLIYRKICSSGVKKNPPSLARRRIAMREKVPSMLHQPERSFLRAKSEERASPVYVSAVPVLTSRTPGAG